MLESNRFFCKALFASVLLIFSLHSYAQEEIISEGLEVIDDIQAITDNAAGEITKINGAFKKVTDNAAWKTLVDGQAIQFPYGVLPDGGDEKYALVVNSVNLDPVQGMTAEIFMKIEYKTGKHLCFMADKVPLSKSGSLLGELKLFLVSKVEIEMGDGLDLIIKGLDNPNKAISYVTFDCEGFKEMYINGRLHLDEKTVKIAPKDSTASATTEVVREDVNLDFFVNADRVANIIVKFSNVPDLEFAKLPGFRVSVPEMTFDFSDERNAPNFILPTWYGDSLASKITNFDRTLLVERGFWQGVYIPSVTITIPKSFKEGEDNSPGAVITSQHIILDEYGISALTSAVGAPLVKADLGGFKASVNSIKINIIASKLSQASIEGDMVLPISDEGTPLSYSLFISQSMADDSELEYDGTIEVNKKIKANIFGLAQMELTRCELNFNYSNKKFRPSAEMDGSLTVGPKKKGASKSSGNLGFKFNKLLINSKAPYVSLDPNGGTFEMIGGDKNSMGKFPVYVSKKPKILIKDNGQTLGLNMGLGISFQKSKEGEENSGNGFNGEAEFTIWAKRNAVSKKWQYEGFDLNRIALEVDQGSFYLKGELTMFNDDPAYGKGYCGNVEIKLIKKIEVKAAIIFGKKLSLTIAQEEAHELAVQAAIDGGTVIPDITEVEGTNCYRYWFVDAMVTFSPAIPIFSGVELNSFTGGLYYNMSMLGPNDVAPITEVDCKTASGRKFVPQHGVFGLLAGIGIQSAGGGNAFNGNINFGLEFFLPSHGGGLKRIATWGGVMMVTNNFSAPGLEAVAAAMNTEGLSDTKKAETESATPPVSSVSANWYVEYDFPNKTLVGDFEVFMNLSGVITGVGPNGRAGKISIYSSPDEWYVYVGTPTDMNGVDVVGLVQIGSYMCFGSKLPDPPIAPVPPEITPSVTIDYSLLSVGGGFSFGARLSVGGEPGLDLGLSSSKVRLKFVVHSGFDILLSQSNQPVMCAGTGERGIEGWYATGQAYFYGEAGLGAQWDCTVFGSGSVDLFSFYLSAYVFAQLPRPSFFYGEVSVGFRFLKKDWNKSFDLEIGETCTASTLSTAVEFIAGIDPADSTKNVGVGEKIAVYFREPIFDFKYEIQNDENNSAIYRGYTDRTQIKILDDAGNELAYELEYSDDFLQMTLTPIEVMPGSSDITVQVTVLTQREEGISWAPTANAETLEVTFTTAPEPTLIPNNNIYYSYPTPDMENFYSLEAARGFVRFASLPKEAIKLADDYVYAVAFYDGNNEIDRSSNVSYNPVHGQKNFEFDLPTNRLEQGKRYTFRIMKSPRNTNSVQTETEESETMVVGTLDDGREDTTIVEFNFTTSKYQTFQEKMSLYGTSFSEVFNGVLAVDLSLNELKVLDEDAYEPFTTTEMVGLVNEGIRVTDPFIHFGEIIYADASLTRVQNAGYSGLNLQNDAFSSGYSSTTSLFSDLNDGIRDVNLNCLLEGGCSGDNLAQVKIPAGKFTMPVGYYLPGETTHNSMYNIVVDLDTDIILPY